MFDGDPNTAAFFTANDSDDPEIRYGFFIQSSVVDLGVDFPINRIRLFPRLADTPGIGHILDEMAPPRLRTEELAEEGFAGNFVPWFEVPLPAATSTSRTTVCGGRPSFGISNTLQGRATRRAIHA